MRIGASIEKEGGRSTLVRRRRQARVDLPCWAQVRLPIVRIGTMVLILTVLILTPGLVVLAWLMLARLGSELTRLLKLSKRSIESLFGLNWQQPPTHLLWHERLGPLRVEFPIGAYQA
jgi:hypothetical protein